VIRTKLTVTLSDADLEIIKAALLVHKPDDTTEVEMTSDLIEWITALLE
jgi:hypothetical protein